MDEIKGKTVVFTDLHCGLAGNKLSRLSVCAGVVKEIIAYAEKNGVENAIFAGDWFHSRSTLDVNTINVAIKLVQALAKRTRLYLVCGNHDSFLKNSTDVNSLNIFGDTPNVRVVSKPEEIRLNSQRCLLVPWLTDMSKYAEGEFDLMVGHFEISSKYLVQAYIDDAAAKRAAGEAAAGEIDAALRGAARKSDSLIGSFVDVVKKGGCVYAGHIHSRKEFSVRGRDFVFVGSPYQQTLGEMDSDCGFYVLDEANARTFVRVESAPRHVQVPMSEAVSGKFDFSKAAGAIVQRVYDVEVDPKDDAEVSRRLADYRPYEELTPDYVVAASGAEGSPSRESIELIKRSKLEYMRKYVDGIDQKALDEQGVDRDRLFSTLESYYRKVTEGGAA